MVEELSEEDVFANDIDPLDAIRELRKQENSEISPELEEAADIAQESASSKEEPSDDDTFEEDLTSETEEQETEDDQEVQTEEESDQNTDEEAGTEEEQVEEETSEKSEEEKVIKAITKKFKANGQEFEFTQEEVMEQFETVFGKAMDYTQKMQKIAPYRKMISALEQEGITQDQLNIALDALKGNKDALQEIMKINEIDTYDLNSEEESNPYTPTDYGKNEGQLAIEEVTGRIEGDPEYKITVDVVDNQWDQPSRQILADNPTMIEGLHYDIKSGLYDKVAPIAMKMKVLDGNTKSSLEYYMLAGEQYQKQQQADNSQQKVDDLNKETQAAESKFDKASSEAKKKRSATSTGARADRKGVIDYLDDDDEAFDAWYKNLQANN